MVVQLFQIFHVFMKPEHPLPYLGNPTNETCNQPVESLQVGMSHPNILLRSTARYPDKYPGIRSIILYVIGYISQFQDNVILKTFFT